MTFDFLDVADTSLLGPLCYTLNNEICTMMSITNQHNAIENTINMQKW